MQLGSKRTLRDLIGEATGISRDRLTYFDPNFMGAGTKSCSFSEVASWAASRITTRPEDIAYSLLGILNVNMPLLYGEGGVKAFIRLQLEYLGRIDDETVFCWAFPSNYMWNGLLALSPKHFEHFGEYRPREWDRERPPFQMTSKGIRTEARLLPDSRGTSDHASILLLNCYQPHLSPQSCVGVHIDSLWHDDDGCKYAIRDRYPQQMPIELLDYENVESDRCSEGRVLYFPQAWEYSPPSRGV